MNILLILIPLGFMPKYFAEAKLFRGEAGLGANVINDIQVGPYTLDLAEMRDEAPRADGPAGHFKVFNASLCKACVNGVKAAYLRIGKPRSLRAAGTIFFGAPYNMGTSLPIPPRTKPDAQIWDHPGRLGRQHAPGIGPSGPRHRQPPWPGSRNKEARNETPDTHPRPALAGVGRLPGPGAQPDVRV
ncbi:hypothetical protein PPS11_39693 [Pseudomonas putida S11]|nr:hypothetical protein PPS11_39693 [Pseudomonas putida S11]